MSPDLSWTFEPGVLIGVAIVGGAYLALVARAHWLLGAARSRRARSGACAASSARCWSR